ncbi:MAG: hypothetical protein EAX81_00210 [Candidatus Thorarchaeota archaeon]|nr:hypothetical protein [Candidatus Thorarchaeota archaeon]
MVFQTLASKKVTLFPASKEDLMIGLGKSLFLSEACSFIYSRCGVVACTNTLEPFYNREVLNSLMNKLDSVISM